jgi:hypothetical protein
MIPSVYTCHSPGEVAGVAMEYPMGTVRAPSPIVDYDPISGSAYPDDALQASDMARSGPVVHGSHLVNAANAQAPLPMQIGGGSPLGPTGKAPAMLAAGGDLVSAPNRYGRYPAIRNIRPETTATIGSVSRQSYQYVTPLVPMPMPFNAFGNPPSPSGEPSRARMIDDTMRPALEPPRYNYVGLDTGYIQEQHDVLQIKAMMAGGG